MLPVPIRFGSADGGWLLEAPGRDPGQMKTSAAAFGLHGLVTQDRRRFPSRNEVRYSMNGGRIRIRMEAYDHIALDASAREIVDHAKRTNAKVKGPVPLPTRIERYTVLRGPFVDKKSREQFEIRTHKRIIDIHEPNARTVEALNRLVVPAGVFVKIKA